MKSDLTNQTNFWSKLEKPFIGLAPMDGVGDHPYRYIQKKYGQPDIIYTEFATVEGFCRGVTVPLRDFIFDKTQRPIIAQIYGKTPQFFRETATVVCQLGFDGIDINMGCPAKSVANGGAGAGLINTPKLAQEIIEATQAGVQDWVNGKTATDCEHITPEIAKEVEKRSLNLSEEYQQHQSIPVSVKTRIGFDSPIIDQWLPILLETKPAAIAIHGRTLRQGYSGKADWNEIGKAVRIAKDSSTLIIGNGDVSSKAEALEKVNQSGVDGVLIGRASFGNPWAFNDEDASINQKAAVALEHAQLYEKTFNEDEKYSFLPMRKHLSWYIKSFEKAKEVRKQLVLTNNSQEVKEIFDKYELL
ncbi:MAG: tRNA-dihydrouridine synthase [Candidatus Pacebacteria bacterium]|jgi:tRNA-dihydrouridine synthase B|nr:tRNA-dihydrouridine synthase [Candidatus Paceibacterota bacterium]MBT3511569.1 tRNA-dihydrouridine synthase [Candidatus Paceibacterota bacterium]MBT4004961.1 tRNA-dihydrouridine synthase [Candidatus Paceibacterota bacterium]MBT4358737.1 tRNA-dihydrouridine synthase [Candidatus Paceibacterota bacterium]MBT4680704.1 tRNA-dihydrouridine synthase [Candidatus Paceibacterota bacterium]